MELAMARYIQHTSDFQAKFEMVWAEKICDRQKNRLERAQRETEKKNVANRLTVASFLPVADSIKFNSILGFDIGHQKLVPHVSLKTIGPVDIKLKKQTFEVNDLSLDKKCL
jgi:hypothetical protein